LSNSTGTLASSYIYDAFGELTASTGTLANPFQYTGREFDQETGVYYYRARYYDPKSGRFNSEDPLRWANGPAFYLYVMNSPVVLTDPLGLFPCMDTLAFANELDENKSDKSTHHCAMFVRWALEAGGMDTSGHPDMARKYGPFLQNMASPRSHPATPRAATLRNLEILCGHSATCWDSAEPGVWTHRRIRRFSMGVRLRAELHASIREQSTIQGISTGTMSYSQPLAEAEQSAWLVEKEEGERNMIDWLRGSAGRKLLILLLFLSSGASGQVAPDSASGQCRKFVRDFYDWYTPIANSKTDINASDIAIRERAKDFAPDLLAALQDDSRAQADNPGMIVGLDYDPFLNSQDPAAHYSIGRVIPRGNAFWVEVFEESHGKKAPKPSIVPEVKIDSGKCVFVNFHNSVIPGKEEVDLLSWLKTLKKQREKSQK